MIWPIMPKIYLLRAFQIHADPWRVERLVPWWSPRACIGAAGTLAEIGAVEIASGFEHRKGESYDKK